MYIGERADMKRGNWNVHQRTGHLHQRTLTSARGALHRKRSADGLPQRSTHVAARDGNPTSCTTHVHQNSAQACTAATMRRTNRAGHLQHVSARAMRYSGHVHRGHADLHRPSANG